MKDALLSKLLPLPSAAGAIDGEALQIKGGDIGVPPAGSEAVIELPQLSNIQLPSGSSITARLQHSPDGSTWTSLYGDLLVQTGAGAGAAKQSKRIAFPSDCGRYIRLQIDAAGSVSATDAIAELYLDF